MGTANKISSFKIVILHCAIQCGSTNVCTHMGARACTLPYFTYKLLTWRSRKMKLNMLMIVLW